MRPAGALVSCAAVVLVFAAAGQALAHGAEAQVASDAAWRIAVGAPLQLAGLIMWVPAGLVYVAAALALLGGALRDDGAVPRPRRDPLGAPG